MTILSRKDCTNIVGTDFRNYSIFTLHIKAVKVILKNSDISFVCQDSYENLGSGNDLGLKKIAHVLGGTYFVLDLPAQSW